MYPDLSYFLHDILGTPVDNWTSIFKTFGLLLGLAFFSSAYVLYKEFKRKEEEGIIAPMTKTIVKGRGATWSDVLINALVGFIFGFKIPYIVQNFDSFKGNEASVVFSTEGILWTGLIAAVLVGAIFYVLGNKTKLEQPVEQTIHVYPHEKVGDITLVAAISGILGARLFSIMENMESFLQDPLGQLFSGSGLTIYGGLILAFIVVFIFVKRMGINPIHVMDAVAPALVVGYAVGRLGCQFSGDGDWGIANELAKPSWFFFPDWMWAYEYPRNVLAQGVAIEGCEGIYCKKLSPAVYPTPVYEVLANIVIFSILWIMRKRVKVAGTIFFTYCIFNGIQRFWIEKIRVNERYDYLGLDWSQAQYIGTGLVIIGIIGLVYLNFMRPKNQSA